MIILSSRSETALRNFASCIIPVVDCLAKTLNDQRMRELRNKAAHEEADQTRAWALGILGMV